MFHSHDSDADGRGMDGRRVRSEETWAEARDAYLAGAGAAEVCERFGLGVSALRLRARREGWRRADQPDPAPDEADALLEDEVAALVADPPAPAEMAARAWARAAAALGRGRLRDAQGWTKLWRELTAAAAKSEEGARDRARLAKASAEHRAACDDAGRTARSIIATMKTVNAARHAAERAGELHSLHSVHPVSGALDADGDESRAVHSAHPQKGLTQSRKDAKEGEKATEAARSASPNAESVLRAFAPSRDPFSAGPSLQTDAGLNSVHSVHHDRSALEPDAPPRPLNRAERRRRERLAAKGRNNGADRGAATASSGSSRARDGP